MLPVAELSSLSRMGEKRMLQDVKIEREFLIRRGKSSIKIICRVSVPSSLSAEKTPRGEVEIIDHGNNLVVREEDINPVISALMASAKLISKDKEEMVDRFARGIGKIKTRGL